MSEDDIAIRFNKLLAEMFEIDHEKERIVGTIERDGHEFKITGHIKPLTDEELAEKQKARELAEHKQAQRMTLDIKEYEIMRKLTDELRKKEKEKIKVTKRGGSVTVTKSYDWSGEAWKDKRWKVT